eukprot:30991-Pelagococcus_subviridis.AAC.10
MDANASHASVTSASRRDARSAAIASASALLLAKYTASFAAAPMARASSLRRALSNAAHTARSDGVERRQKRS